MKFLGHQHRTSTAASATGDPLEAKRKPRDGGHSSLSPFRKTLDTSATQQPPIIIEAALWYQNILGWVSMHVGEVTLALFSILLLIYLLVSSAQD
jgi:hypothetical protein